MAAATVELATAHLLEVSRKLAALCVANCCYESEGRVALVLIELGCDVSCRYLRDIRDRLNGFLADNLGHEFDIAFISRSCSGATCRQIHHSAATGIL